jgi:polysaccharide biosynthesis protein VpsM
MRVLSLSILLALTASANAADGTGVQAGPFRVKPTIGLTFGNESNVGLSGVNEVSSFVTRVSPGIRLDAGNEQRSMTLSYEIDSARYSDSKIDNYTDHALSIGGVVSPSARARFEGEAHYQLGHDRRGENSRQGRFAELTIEPDEWAQKGGSVGFGYGAPGARAGFNVGVGVDDLSYRNNESFTRDADRSETHLEGEFLYRLGAKTRAFVGARQNDIDYDRERTRLSRRLNLDSVERLYSLGMEFDASAKTSGRFAVQKIRKEFDDAGLEEFSGTGYEVGLKFSPRSYSSFDLSASRRTDEAINFIPTSSFAAGDTQFILARDITLAWTHGWSDRLQTSVDVGQSSQDFQADDRSRRDDRVNFWGVSTGFQMRPWLNIGAGYRSADRSSSDKQFEYDNDEFLVSFEASL